MILRFAPSPTGYLHLANARVALLNYVKSVQTNGKFILRLDDTDVERTKQEYIDQLFVDMKWLGIEFDEMFKQSDRYDIYNKFIEDLKQAGVIYACYETPDELAQMREKQLALKQAPRYKPLATADTTRAPHWRFKLANVDVSWNDNVMGELKFSGQQASDPVVLREDGTMTYILASLIDDYTMGVTHIVRGRDHVSNTAVQLQMLHTLNQVYNTDKQITFSHFPLISSLDGKVFSKREGSFALKHFIEEGLDSSIVSRFLLSLGLSEPLPEGSLKELCNKIVWEKYGKADLKCDPEQIWQLNKKHISTLSADAAKNWLRSYELPMLSAENWEQIWNVLKFEIGNLTEVYDWQKILNGEYDAQNIDKDLLQETLALIVQNPESDWQMLAKQMLSKNPDLKMPILGKNTRKALVGMEHGVKIGELWNLLGRDEVIKRLQTVLN